MLVREFSMDEDIYEGGELDNAFPNDNQDYADLENDAHYQEQIQEEDDER